MAHQFNVSVHSGLQVQLVTEFFLIATITANGSSYAAPGGGSQNCTYTAVYRECVRAPRQAVPDYGAAVHNQRAINL